MDLQIFGMAGRYAGRLECAGRRVEAGMQDVAVRLRGAVEDVRRLLHPAHPCAVESEAARDGAAHYARADHRNVEGVGRWGLRTIHES